MKLTEAEKGSALWTRIREHVVDRTAKLRIENDRLTSTEEETAARRGRIAELRMLLDIEREQPQVPQD